MGCGSSMHKGDAVGAPQAVAEAEEAALARLREDNAELRRQNAQLISQVQELSERVTTLSMDVSGLRMELSQAAATASKALQVAHAATERAEAAASTAAVASQARPPTANGPIPIPSLESQLLQRVQQVESQLSSMQDKLESQRAKEEFARQLRAAQGDRPPIPLPPQQQHPTGTVPPAAGAAGSPSAQCRPSAGNDLGSGSFGSSGFPAAGPASAGASTGSASSGCPALQPPAAAPTQVIDGSGLLPANNNFPSRFGAGGLRAARDRTPGRAGPAGGGNGGGGGAGNEDISSHGSTPISTQNGLPLAGEFMSTVRYGSVLPSDLKLAEQRKQGPRQFL
ncbi:hypothetical protein Vretimale_3208 [Volvox reticuliferus]|uniref:Uncharacterized protein n=1 Tax=Volvox reticuliferus TaxID=1737510 RepID=A0A8J4G4J2_9CHLO|nr:hypothetical protein Vretifemale_6664 [Volvox reticuliferus]GIL97582.1 hypothetical protein Vretimale_3208 [Volvox reticuliferus]